MTTREWRQTWNSANRAKPSISWTGSLPEKPSFPNRPLFAGVGFAFGLALGVGLILLLEYRDKSIVGEQDVEFFLKIPTLAAVPYIEPQEGSKISALFNRFRRKQAAEAHA